MKIYFKKVSISSTFSSIVSSNDKIYFYFLFYTKKSRKQKRETNIKLYYIILSQSESVLRRMKPHVCYYHNISKISSYYRTLRSNRSFIVTHYLVETIVQFFNTFAPFFHHVLLIHITFILFCNIKNGTFIKFNTMKCCYNNPIRMFRKK